MSTSLMSSAAVSSVLGNSASMSAEVADDAGGEVDWEVAPLEVLERRLTSWAATLAAAEAEWLRWLAVYVRREGHVQWECRSAAHWLSWKCGMSLGTAREKVRAALALEDLPLIAAEFSAGRLSYSKVRALTRVANEFNEVDLCSMAVNASGAQLDAICAGYRRSRPDPSADADGDAGSVAAAGDADVARAAAAFDARSFSVRDNHDGTTTIVWTLPTDAATAVVANVEAEVDVQITDAGGRPDDDRDDGDDRDDHVGHGDRDDHGDHDAAANAAGPIGAPVVDGESNLPRSRRELIADRGGIRALRSDAAQALICERPALEPTANPATATTEVTLVIPNQNVPAGTSAPTQLPPVHPPPVHPESSLAGTVDGKSVEPPVTKRLSCDPLITALVEGADRQPLAVGRATRLISRRLRLALEHRDRRTCQFPGCPSTRRLHAHHIVHWSAGGPTDLDNLILLCHFHHHSVHDRGWIIAPDRTFQAPDGALVDRRPAVAVHRFAADVSEFEHERCTRPPGHLEPVTFGPFDLPWTTTILHHNEQLRRDRSSTTVP